MTTADRMAPKDSHPDNNPVSYTHLGISIDMAIRLSKAFGSSPEMWLGLQMAYDLWQARERVRSIRVRHFKAA